MCICLESGRISERHLLSSTRILLLILTENLSTPDRDRPSADDGFQLLERKKKTYAVMRLERPTYRCGPEEDGFLYVLGATIGKWVTYVGGCTSCKELLCEDPPTDSFIYERKYTDDSQLCYPSKALSTYISAVDGIIQRSTTTRLHERRVIHTFCKIITNHLRAPPSLACDTHTASFSSSFLKKWVSTSLRIFIKNKSEQILRQKFQRRKRKKLMSLQVSTKRRKTEHNVVQL